MAELISSRELAKRLNVAPNSVMRAISAGKVLDCYEASVKKFDWSKAKKNEWVQSASVVKPQRGVSLSKAVEKIDRAEKIELPKLKGKENKKLDPKKNIEPESLSGQEEEGKGESLDELSEDEIADRIKFYSNMPIQQAMRAKVIFDGLKAKQDYKKAQGLLIEITDVKKSFFNFNTRLKKALLQMPDIITDELMINATNKVELLNIQKRMISEILTEYSKFPEIQSE